jgi:hypothetical protein
MMHTMPFNTGVVFSRCQAFWVAVLEAWRRYPASVQQDWLSEQRAVYEVVRSGRFRVKILPGVAYNYPPMREDDTPIIAAMIHYKGPRKAWRSAAAYKTLSAPVQEMR